MDTKAANIYSLLFLQPVAPVPYTMHMADEFQLN